MALLFTDGADAYATAQVTSKWTNAAVVGGASISVASPGYLGTGNYLLFGGVANSATLTKALPGAPYTSLVHGFRFKWFGSAFANQEIFVYQDNGGSLLGTLNITTSGQLFYQNSNNAPVAVSAAGVLNVNAWTYIEASIVFSNATGGSVTLKVNQAQVGTASSVNTSGSNANGLTLCGPFNSNVGVSPTGFDDLYFLSTSGGHTSFLGAVNVLVAEVNGNGRVNAWTAVGAGANYQCVDQYPPDDDTTYVESSTTSQEDCYTVAPIAGISTVVAVQGVLYARVDNAPAHAIEVGFGNGSSEVFGSGQTLDQNYTCILQEWDVNPISTSAWVVADINSTGQICVTLSS